MTINIYSLNNYFRRPVATAQSFLCIVYIMISNGKRKLWKECSVQNFSQGMQPCSWI